MDALIHNTAFLDDETHALENSLIQFQDEKTSCFILEERMGQTEVYYVLAKHFNYRFYEILEIFRQSGILSMWYDLNKWMEGFILYSKQKSYSPEPIKLTFKLIHIFYMSGYSLLFSFLVLIWEIGPLYVVTARASA